MTLQALEVGVVFRLANITHTFPPESAKPLPFHFAPSSADKERALATGHPVLVSVFDLAWTTVLQARDLRSTEVVMAAFRLDVMKVLEIGTAERPRALRAVRDPLDPPLADAPGADGHCGIEGLHRKSGEEKRLYRSLRSQLTDIAFRLEY